MSDLNQLAQNAAATQTTEATPEQIAAAQKEAESKARIAAVAAKFDNKVEVKEVDFGFRTMTDKDTKVKTKRPTVSLAIPFPSFEGVIAILEEGGKQKELLMEAVQDVIISQVREYVNENENANQDNFDETKFTWEYIANMPKSDRRGGGIPEEIWEAFKNNYIEIMPAITQKTKEQVELAAKVFVSKFANAKTNKPVLKVLQGQLALYINATQIGEEIEPVLTWLTTKLDTYINNDETKLLNAL